MAYVDNFCRLTLAKYNIPYSYVDDQFDICKENSRKKVRLVLLLTEYECLECTFAFKQDSFLFYGMRYYYIAKEFVYFNNITQQFFLFKSFTLRNASISCNVCKIGPFFHKMRTIQNFLSTLDVLESYILSMLA